MRAPIKYLLLGLGFLAALPVLGTEPDSPSLKADPALPADVPAYPTASESGKVPPETVQPGRTYDQIFGEILQNLPGKSRAKVDSARVKAGAAAIPSIPDAGRNPDPARGDMRGKALEALTPELKARVEKAIQELEKKRKERELEFKELGK